MNRRSFFKRIAGAIVGVFAVPALLKGKSKEKPSEFVPSSSSEAALHKKLSRGLYDVIYLHCPICLQVIGKTTYPSMPYPPTMYCRKCEKGFTQNPSDAKVYHIYPPYQYPKRGEKWFELGDGKPIKKEQKIKDDKWKVSKLYQLPYLPQTNKTNGHTHTLP